MAANGKKLPRGISRLPNGTYRARIFVDGTQHSIGAFMTIGDARAALDIARAEKARGTFVPPADKRRKHKADAAQRRAQAVADSRTVRDMFTAWQQWQERRGLKLGTRYTYARHLEAHFLPEFGDRSIAAVTAEDVADWIDRLEQSHGIKTAAQIHQTVAAMFKWATGDAPDLPVTFRPWLLASPIPPLAATRLRRARQITGDPKVLATDADISELAAGMPDPERLAVLLAGWCGLRLGEVLGLRRRHITTTGTGDNAVTWIRIETQVQARGSGVREETPKSTAGVRSIPVPAHIAAELAKHLAEHAGPGKDGLLFHRKADPLALHNPNTVRKHFNAALAALNAPRKAGTDDRAPLDPFTFHGLRHAALTRLGQAGATTAELKAYAGHSDGASVEVYQHADRQRLATLAGAVSVNAESIA